MKILKDYQFTLELCQVNLKIMKFLVAFAISCLIYQVSAGGISFSPETSATAPPTQNLCADCDNFYYNAGPLSEPNCDPAGKRYCSGEAIETGGDIRAGYCAGTVTRPDSNARSPAFKSADVYCYL